VTNLERSSKYAGAVATVVAVVWLMGRLTPHANLTTVALALVVAVTVCAVNWGSGPALVAAALSGLSFNYFFIPPVHTWHIADPQNWIAFSAFCVSALLVGHLFARARAEAEAAESRRIEIERLYEQLKQAFEEASQAESLRRSEQLKTALLDAVTHELQTPLTAIKASVTTLLAPSPQDEGARLELLEVINEESDRLNHFIEQMMTMARVESGTLLQPQAPTRAPEIINAALDRSARWLAEHPIEVTIEEKLPPLMVDAASISNVVVELLQNAAKYSPAGSPIHVRAGRADAGLARVSVENGGKPIPANLREKVFQKFFRVSTPTAEQHGFGMGLSIARGIVEAHSGRIWVDEGAGGRGTVVSFTVPCKSVA
jgi:K+-sensing histidine kinase KdpD